LFFSYFKYFYCQWEQNVYI